MFGGQNRKRSSHEKHAALTFTAMGVTPQQQVLSFQDVSDPVYASTKKATCYFSPGRFWAPGWQVSSCLCLCIVSFSSRKLVTLANNRFWGEGGCYSSLMSMGPCRSLRVLCNLIQLCLGQRISWRWTEVPARMSKENKSQLTLSNSRSSFRQCGRRC